MFLDLHILVIGCNGITTRVANTLLGREFFTEKKKDTQYDSVLCQYRRNLHVTAALGDPFDFGSDGKRFKDKFVTEINSRENSALVLVVEFHSNQIMMWKLLWEVVEEDESFRDLIREKGVIVVSGADKFRQACEDGEISVTFSKWMAQQSGIEGEFVQLVQGRCLLLDTSRNNQDVLVAQRNELIGMIDRRVLGWIHTDVKFMETEQITQKEQQLSDLNQRIIALEQQEKTNFIKLEEMNQLLKTNLQEMKNEIKEHMQEVRQQLATTSREATTKSEDILRKISERLENFERKKKQRVSALNEESKRSEATENPLSDLKRKRRE